MKSWIISTFFAATLATGCVSVKPSATKSAKKYIETFFVGEEGTQYFIKPLLFESKSTESDMMVDMTFRYKDQIKDSALLHFSLEGPEIYKSIPQIEIQGDTLAAPSNAVNLMFNEKTKKGYVSRFNTKISLKELHALFSSNNWTIQIGSAPEVKTYIPTKKTRKVLSVLKEEVFILM